MNLHAARQIPNTWQWTICLGKSNKALRQHQNMMNLWLKWIEELHNNVHKHRLTRSDITVHNLSVAGKGQSICVHHSTEFSNFLYYNENSLHLMAYTGFRWVWITLLIHLQGVLLLEIPHVPLPQHRDDELLYLGLSSFISVQNKCVPLIKPVYIEWCFRQQIKLQFYWNYTAYVCYTYICLEILYSALNCTQQTTFYHL